MIILKQAHPPSDSPGRRRHIRVEIPPPRPLISLRQHQPFSTAALYSFGGDQKVVGALAGLFNGRTLLLSSFMEFGAIAPAPAARGLGTRLAPPGPGIMQLEGSCDYHASINRTRTPVLDSS